MHLESNCDPFEDLFMPLYFIAVVAPREIDQLVLTDKGFMRDQYGCKVALRSPAHITLIPPFAMSAVQEQDLSIQLETFVLGQPSFQLTLQNYNYFPPRVIFIDVLPSVELVNIKHLLEELFVNKGTPNIRKEDRPFHPHITIANRDLEKKDFHLAKDHFSKKNFKAYFTVNSICLLKNTPMNWEILREFKFRL